MTAKQKTFTEKQVLDALQKAWDEFGEARELKVISKKKSTYQRQACCGVADNLDLGDKFMRYSP